MTSNQNNTSLGEQSPNEYSFLRRVSDFIEKVNLITNNITHYVSMTILFVLMLLTSADIIGRFFFNKPITGTFELTGILLALIIFFSLGTLQNKGEHIDIDFLTNKFPVKLQEILKMIVSLFLFIFLVLVTWQVFELMKRMHASNSISGDLGFPMYIIVALVGIGSLLFTVSYLSQIFKDLIKVVSKK